MQSEDENKFGDRVAFYKAALEKLNDAAKSAKSMEKTDVSISKRTHLNCIDLMIY